MTGFDNYILLRNTVVMHNKEAHIH